MYRPEPVVQDKWPDMRRREQRFVLSKSLSTLDASASSDGQHIFECNELPRDRHRASSGEKTLHQLEEDEGE